VASKANPNSVVDLKSAALTLVALVIKTADLDRLAEGLRERFDDAPALLDGEPVAIDLAALREADTPVDFPALLELLRSHAMLPIAARGGSPAQMEAAAAAGLIEAHGAAPARAETAAPRTAAAAPPPAAAPAPALPFPPVPGARPTVVVDRPLRSGQQVYARGADLIVLSAVSFGAEVIADGHIHVYAPLRGRAIAGAQGNTDARIFTTCMQPQLVSIAGTYRTTDTELPADVLGKPAQVRLVGDRLIVEALAS
jgi:septum site-determining protein MinC